MRQVGNRRRSYRSRKRANGEEFVPGYENTYHPAKGGGGKKKKKGGRKGGGGGGGGEGGETRGGSVKEGGWVSAASKT